MSAKRTIWLFGTLLVGLLLVACTLPLVRTPTEPAPPFQPQGIDPTLPHAQGVLMHYCASNQCDLRLIDPVTGEIFDGYPPFAIHGGYFQFAPDRRTLALIDYRDSQAWSLGALTWVDLSQWQLVTTTITVGNLNCPP